MIICQHTICDPSDWLNHMMTLAIPEENRVFLLVTAQPHEGRERAERLVLRFPNVRWNPAKRELLWPTGARTYIFNSTNPYQMKGVDCSGYWFDGVDRWENAEITKDMVFMQMRKYPMIGIMT